MISSLLVLKEVPPLARPARGVFVLLHGRRGDVSQLVSLAQRLRKDFHLVAVEGPRAVIAYTVENADLFDGYEWYPAVNGEVQELARFGHALASLEQVIVDVIRQHTDLPVYLLGKDQGGSMALTIASVMPEFVAGVASIGGALPTGSILPLEARELNGLPVLLLDTDGEAQETESILRDRGATMCVAALPKQADACTAIANWLAGHSTECIEELT